MGDLARLQRIATGQGWTVSRSGSGHLCWTAPDGGRTWSHLTASDARAIKNLTADLRRLGLRLPQKDGRMRV
jgi:hypothetical protein